MNTVPAEEMVGDGNAYRAHHRQRQGPLFLGVAGALLLTAIVLVVAAIEFSRGTALRDPTPAAIVIIVAWVLVALELGNTLRHSRFYAGPSEFTPNVIPFRRFARGSRRIRYTEVVGGRYGDSNGKWWIELALRDGARARVFQAPDIPNGALHFLIDRLLRAGVAMETRDPLGALPAESSSK